LLRKLPLVLACTLMARVAVAAPALPTPTLNFERYPLKNGLTVVLSEDHRLPLVAVDLWYHVGAANEAAGKSGFAHLFEHLMFQGSKHVTGDEHAFFGILESIGASTINGTTDFDRTNYFETAPANQLETLLWLESDRQGFLLDTLDQKKLDIQRDVVLNEKRQGDNQPYQTAEERLYQLLFPLPHPYNGAVIGLEKDIQSAKLEDVRNFFRTYYAPSNATLVIAGDFDPAKTKELVEKYFGPIAKGPAKPKLSVKTQPLGGEKRETLKDQVHLPKLLLGYATPPIFTDGDAEANLLATVLGKGKTSRLYQRLVYEKQLAQDVSVANTSLVLGSVLEIGVVARPGHDLQEVEAAVQAELDDLVKNPVSDEELDRAKTDHVATTLRQLQELGGFGGRADVLNYYDHYTGDPGYLPKDLARYESVTADSLKKVAGQVLRNDNRVVLDVVPAEAAPAAPPVHGEAAPTPAPAPKK
jgi:zinc protease